MSAMRRVLVFGILLGLGACAGRDGSAPSGPGQPVAVQDVASLAGRWRGLMDLPDDREQYLEVDIQPDGSYRATSARTIGVMDARGRLIVSDGGLMVNGDSGARGRATLLSRNGERTLVIDMARADGRRVTARLRRQP